ncbi:UPF0280 family protein [Methanopyrus sp. KOL6]|uniref:UPF0280 family protein n=1 Tax=Methanopyrus sp. KOL6 TaxID=1937004 RepID=UPI0012F90283|nr:UPF0280 family protein [Methanopyrus sp. KOL6]
MHSTRVVVEETDVTIRADSKESASSAAKAVKLHRSELDRYVARDPAFVTAKVPVRTLEDAPEVAKLMSKAAELFEVGPMAAVAGAIAELAARAAEPTVIVDNGGDVQVRARRSVVVGLYVSDNHPLSGKIGFEIEGVLGICTSSGKFGHSYSVGEADAVTVFAERASLADAAATAICNLTSGDDPEAAVQRALEFADDFTGDLIEAAVVIREDFVGISGRPPKIVSLKGGQIKPSRLEPTI